MKKFLVFISFICSFLSFSQNTRQIIDSLKNELNKNPAEIQKAKIYGDLCWYYNSVSLDSALIYGNKSAETAQKLNDDNLYAQSLNDLGAVYYLKGNMNKALALYKKSLTIREKQKNEERIAALHSKIGNIYQKKLELPLAMEYNVKALKYYEKINKEENIAILESNIGIIYFNMKNYSKAFQHFQTAAEYAEKKNMNSTLCNALIGIGNVYNENNKIDLAQQNYERALQIAEKTNNFLVKATVIQNLADIALDKKDYTKALELSRKSLEIREKEKLASEAEKSRIFIGKVYSQLKQFSKAKPYLLTSLKNYEKNGNKDNLDVLYSELINVYSYERKPDSVSHYLNLFKENISKTVNQNIMMVSTDMETKYQTAKKEEQIKHQKIEITNKEKKIRKITTTGIIIFALMIAVTYLVYSNLKLRNKQQKQEYELNSAIEKIEHQNSLQEQRLSISRDLHDNIGAQLTFIISSIDTLKDTFVLNDDKINNKLSSISNFTKDTIVELRDTIWAMNQSNIDFEEMRLRILNFIEKAQNSHENVHFSFDIDPELRDRKFTSSEGMNIYRIIQESLNNALKYSQAENISVIVKKLDSGETEISVSDDGNGFDKNEITAGNGLRNMKKRAQEIGKDFNIYSEKGKGTKVFFVMN